MTRVAAIDCGTNSIRLLVADVDGETLVDLVRDMRVVRLGQDVDRTGRIAPEALDRTLTALGDYTTLLRELGAARVRMCATSATRDAANRDEFVTGVRSVLGADPEVVTGDEEAALSFAGATRGAALDLPSPYLVVDIGGGSTELVLGGRTVTAARSIDIGCVRLTERHLHDDPPTAEQIAAAVADVEAGLDLVAETVPLQDTATLVGVAGSVTTVAGIALDLPAYDPDRIHLHRMPADTVADVTARLLGMTRAERAAMPVMHPGRADVIGAGALILDTVVRRLGVPSVVASEHDILDGIAWSAADGAGSRVR